MANNFWYKTFVNEDNRKHFHDPLNLFWHVKRIRSNSFITPRLYTCALCESVVAIDGNGTRTRVRSSVVNKIGLQVQIMSFKDL